MLPEDPRASALERQMPILSRIHAANLSTAPIVLLTDTVRLEKGLNSKRAPSHCSDALAKAQSPARCRNVSPLWDHLYSGIPTHIWKNGTRIGLA
jgi:hypothetical protein